MDKINTYACDDARGKRCKTLLIMDYFDVSFHRGASSDIEVVCLFIYSCKQLMR